jgi:hypothetical protein
MVESQGEDVADFDRYGPAARLVHGPARDPRGHPGQQGGERGSDDYRHRRDPLHPQRSSGNGNYVGGTGTCSGGTAYYDAYTTQATNTALGSSLAAFHTQDDDPIINGSAGATFLASMIKTFIDSIRTTVLAAYSGAKFEPLWPYDVNFSTCYYTRMSHTRRAGA